MPRDKRLYMTFPIDVHRHPKMQRLTAEVKWAFVEMNGEARLAGNDGRFSAEDAEYMWPVEVLESLLKSHPVRPLLVRDGTDYVIRDYAEHQLTVAAIAELSAKRSDAGRIGAEVTNAKRAASAAKKSASAEDSAASAGQVVGKLRQASAESESEIELDKDLDTTTDTQESLEPYPAIFETAEVEGFRKALTAFGSDSMDDLALCTLVAMLVEASPRRIGNVVGYVVRCTQRSPQKVRNLAVEAERQAARVRAAVA